MVKFVAVSKEQHGARKWQRPVGFGFAAKEAFVPLVIAELGKAALSMPIGFLQHAGRYSLVAVTSLAPGHNKFVAADGRWLGRYIPAWLRIYPFWLLPEKDSGKAALCVDEDSKLVVEASAEGENFFDAEGKLAPALHPVVQLLTQLQGNLQPTNAAVTALAEAGVIKPWQIKLKPEQGEQAISGLYHVDEVLLGKLSDEAFLKLRKALALPLAYAQLLSEGQLGVLTQLARFHEQRKPPAGAMLPETLDSLFRSPADDTIKFS